ncbi:MAG: germination protein YpeB, partial [Clostridia bacterium]|nr:germination protein YpeB [Clostridia bacterium]
IKSFNELVDNINNTDIKLSKVLASDYNSYAKKLLNEISKNTSQASQNLSELPISINGVDEIISFVNQVSGYTQSLAEKIDKGQQLSQQEINTITQIKVAFDDLKDNINKLSMDIYNGNIYKDSAKLDGDYNQFTLRLKNVKAGDVDYPTMIYDGPFSDSTLNKKIKNLNQTKVSQEFAEQKIKEWFKNVSNSNCQYLGVTEGKFETYDYELVVNDEQSMYVQVTQNGAKLLTLSCYDNNSQQNYTIDQAIEIAQNFTIQTGVTNMVCVWSDIVSSDAYINLAPKVNDVILYPDLIKVKVDLASGLVTGYEASSYYTNHTQREIPLASISKQQAESIVPVQYKIKETRLCLAPLEYNKEVLCYEVICVNNAETYYCYINAQTNVLENILKTIQTDNGNLLM